MSHVENLSVVRRCRDFAPCGRRRSGLKPPRFAHTFVTSSIGIDPLEAQATIKALPEQEFADLI
jgi:hypothetical protein